VRAPNADEATLVRRGCALLAAQAWPCDGLGSVAARALARRGGPALGEPLAAHAARLALAQWSGAAPRGARAPERLATTLDAAVQRAAVQALTRQLAELQGRAVNDGAVVVLDNASGEVLAWVGSAGAATSDAPAVDAVLARRQPGSALKPFVYGLAFEQGLLTAATPLNDAPSAWPAGAGQYVPGNYDGGHRGWVPARVALGASLNVPAVQVAAMVSPELLFDRLNALGLKLPHTAGHHGLSLALGSAEVTLIDLANAYRTLARGGWSSPWRLHPGGAAVAPRRVMDPAAAAVLGEVLADNAARASGFGLDSPLVTRGFAAVKTGTSKDMRDNWCVGFTDRYTVGVWVGNAAGAPMHGVSGTTGAAPVWRELVAALHEGRPSRAPRADPALAPRVAALRGGAATAVSAGRWASGIRHPRDGHRFAIDPDVPPARQRIVFEGEAGDWWLDGRRLGRGERLAWAPWPGRHRLELRDPAGRVIDRAAFEVRGATLRPGVPQDAGNMRSSAASITRPQTL
jgi:penicillin-binding protein 1C